MLLLLLLLTLPALAYDPLALLPGKTTVTDLTIHDIARGRELPIRVYLAADPKGAPIVLFSPGLGGSRETCAYLGRHWAGRGYAAVFLHHPGSDDSVWKDVPPAQRMRAMQAAASGKNLLLRVQDVKAVLDFLPRWKGELDHQRIGMSGHSFGAVTTQALTGQYPRWADPRLDAAVIMSPSSRNQNFGGVKIPWLLMTGTKDVSPIGDTDLASRLGVYPALPPGGKYELILDGAEHSAFTERSTGNPDHHRAILALSTAFWDACLRGDRQALTWLQNPGSVLGKQDSWRHK